jgi:glutathione synthase/RimK-type ligase-like ATP-grasp enzyme
MKAVALATCDRYPEMSEDCRQILPFLAEYGIRPEIVSWSHPDVDWQRFDAIVIRSTWDYVPRFAEFQQWIARIEKAGTRVLNSIDTIRWNWNKRYLAEVGKKGIPIVPTLWASHARDLDAIPWDEFVLKPSVSGGAYLTFRAKRDELAGIVPRLGPMTEAEPYLVQPFLRQIQSEGELSFLYFGGEFSHSILKRPAIGDFRVQHELGGTIHSYSASAEELEQAHAALEASGYDTLYARVDMIRGDDGHLLLVELELIEPFLYLAQGKTAPEQFTRALASTLIGP